LQAKGTCVLDWTSDNQDGKQSSEGMHLNLQQPRSPIARVSINNKSEKILNIASVLDVSSKKIGFKTSNLSEVFIASENCEVIDLDAGDVTGDKNVGDSGSSHSTSILDKLFGSALTLNGTASTGPSSFIEVIPSLSLSFFMVCIFRPSVDSLTLSLNAYIHNHFIFVCFIPLVVLTLRAVMEL
jgi:hypothetical protein